MNEFLDKVFGYIDWLKKYDEIKGDKNKEIELFREYPLQVVTQLIENKIKAEKYFTEVVDQNIYLTEDYKRLRLFLIHWYAAFLVAVSQDRNVSDINNIDKELFLKSLGYELVNLHSPVGLNLLMYELCNLYAKKGSPLGLAKALAAFDVENFTLFEYWLDEDDQGDYVFKPVEIKDIDFFSGGHIEVKNVKPFEAVTSVDPHWFLTRNEIQEYQAAGGILPAISPYIGVLSGYDWMKFSKIVIAYANRISMDILHKILNDPNYNQRNDKKYYFEDFGDYVSLLDVYLSLIYIYNKMFNRSKNVSKLPDDELLKYNGDIMDNITIIGEYNEVFRRVNDLEELKELVNQIKENWLTKNNILGATALEIENVLQLVNPELKNYCDLNIETGKAEDVFVSVGNMFDYYIKQDLGISNFKVSFMLFDPLQKYITELQEIFNYFKPYPTRLIEAATYMILNDIPGDCVVNKEELKIIIYQKLYDYFNTILENLKIRVFQKFFDNLRREGWDNLFGEIVRFIIVHKAEDIYIDIKDKLALINISQVFAEHYVLYKHAYQISIKMKLPDECISYNFEKRNVQHSLMIYESIMYKILQKIIDTYLILDKGLNNIRIFMKLLENYLFSDIMKISILIPVRDKIRYNSNVYSETDIITCLIIHLKNMINLMQKHLDVYRLTYEKNNYQILNKNSEQTKIEEKQVKYSVAQNLRDEWKIVQERLTNWNLLFKIIDMVNINENKKNRWLLPQVENYILYRDQFEIIIN